MTDEPVIDEAKPSPPFPPPDDEPFAPTAEAPPPPPPDSVHQMRENHHLQNLD